MGFENPTDIQRQTIPVLLSEPVDFIGLAQTGTGKTAAFGLPLIELVDADEKHTQALILAPTRELAQQIAGQLEQFSSQSQRLSIVCVFGGANIQEQIRQLRKGAQIVVATPGRLIDIARRGAIKLNMIDFVVLDEADEMLNMGFRDELDTILDQTPKEKITWLFSATMPKEIRQMVKNYMHDPKEVKVDTRQQVNVNIDHQYAVIKASDKVEALRRIIDFNPDLYGVVFCRTRRDTQNVAEKLVETGYTAEALHGELSQSQRDAVMKRFRSKNLQLLIATDVAARGIDVDDLTHVIHFALPDDPEYYVHRSGRTARAGKKGVSLSLITRSDLRRLRFLENKLKINFTKALIPGGSEIARNRIVHWSSKLLGQSTDNLDEEAFNTASTLLEELTREEIIAKLVSREMENLSKSNSLSDLNDSSRGESKGNQKRYRDSGGQEEGMLRHFINIGRVDNLNPGGLVRFICDNTGIKGSDIGRITLENKHAYVDISDKVAGKVKKLNDVDYDGRAIRINRDDSGPTPRRRDRKPKGGKGKFRNKRR
jgi:ATP-dependent RNA helicase DeaD